MEDVYQIALKIAHLTTEFQPVQQEQKKDDWPLAIENADLVNDNQIDKELNNDGPEMDKEKEIEPIDNNLINN